MVQPEPLTLDTLDPLIRQLLVDHREKTFTWMQREPGAWGFLAGQCVAASRKELGRRLTDPERRMVWSRLWWWLEQLQLRLNDDC